MESGSCKTPRGGYRRSKGCCLLDKSQWTGMPDGEDIRSWDGEEEESMG
jgi:hypothetical protein